MRLDLADYIAYMKKHSEKINYASVARQYNCDYRTVKRYFENDVKITRERKQRKVTKKTDGFEAIIEEKAFTYHAPAIAIFHLLQEKYNYTGSYTLIKNYIHSLKEEKQQEVTVRFETSPGLQCQIDWKEQMKLTDRNGEIHEVNIFLGILGYSRLKYIELTFDKTQKTLFKCLTNMFKYFSGVPKELLFDNMRTVVDQSRTQFSDPVYNEKLIKFAKDAGFVPKSCVSFRPQTKGKVETVARIMNRLKVYNNEFTTMDECIQIVKDELEKINNEIQATTLEKPINRFEKEKEYLLKGINFDNLVDYYSEPTIQRKVPNACLITYQNKKYSVPPAYAGKNVTLVQENNILYIYYTTKLISKHEITPKIINYNPEDYKELMKKTFSDQTSIDEICKQNLELLDKLGS